MDAIENKALGHVSKILDSIDVYEIYSTVSRTMSEKGVDMNIQKEVLSKLQKETGKLHAIVRDAKDWVDTLKENSK